MRISFRTDRPAELIEAELQFVQYLAEHGVRVSMAVPSRNGAILESLRIDNTPIHIVSFIKGPGMRVPDNGYRYRENAPIEEYFQNWGRVLGRMHALAKGYSPSSSPLTRPSWFHLHRTALEVDRLVPERLPLVRSRIHALLDEIGSLPKDRDSFGLIHGDFNDGNFTVDYSNGDMTVFDFDDCCYFWFVYEVAAAWEGGIGRTMFRSLSERREFMEQYMAEVMKGYNEENSLAPEWMARLPLFLRLIQVEEFLYFVQYIDEADEEMRARLNYHIKCIEDDVPSMGFYEGFFDPRRPFLL